METETVKKCPYCGKPIETPVQCRILDRWRDQFHKGQYVRERIIEFCSKDCGGYYQMGCEG